MKAIGLMSGTSMDGVDVALIETDGDRILSLGPSGVWQYSGDEREVLRRAVTEAASVEDRNARPDALAEAEKLITNIHAQVLDSFMRDHNLNAASIDLIGFHGQTVLHRPEIGLTIQLGDGARLADLTGTDVIYDFRAADMKAGGQGAPLAPVYHRALADHSQLPKPAVIVNLGGVANLTFIDEDDSLLAFDTGPANALIDDWMLQKTGNRRDENGQLAARGKTDAGRLEALLSHPYFLQKPPKSLDRNAFSLSAVEGLSPENGAATLTAFTAASLICNLAHLPATPQIFVLTGGGTHNATLVGSLRKLLPGLIEQGADLGWNADAIEAQAFAYMAVRSVRGMPLTFPGTTGVSEPVTGGVFVRAPELLSEEDIEQPSETPPVY